MALAPGTRIGPYAVLSVIGAGGMGEVYRAKDTRLDRVVALKVLPAQLAGDPQFRERFEREAKSISALTHPNICTLYDVGRDQDTEFLVLEYLEGETLATRLAKGPLALSEALRIATEIASALETAHRQGIVHRDLKPGNVILTKSGSKLLDFGLAKIGPAGAVFTTTIRTDVPTAMAPLTAQGTILGTIQYMAPEQLEGLEADPRTDIFALGAVLFEMLTGQKAFPGTSQASVMGAILKDEPPPVSQLQPVTPPALDYLVRTCLAKDPDHRFQNAHDVLSQLKWIAEGGSAAGVASPVAARGRSRERMALVAATVLLLAAAALGWIHFTEVRAPARLTRFGISQPDGTFPGSTPLAVSSDGRTIAFVAGNLQGQRAIWLRRIGSLEASPLAGTEGAIGTIFWSPDSRYLGFFANGRILKIDVSGGPAIVLANSTPSIGGTWNRVGSILLGGDGSIPGIRRVPDTGGEVKVVLSPDKTGQEFNMYWPSFLPDGRHFLYYSASSDTAKSGIRIGSLDSDQTVPLVAGAAPAFYVPEGYVLFTRQNTAFALPFDAHALRATGEPVPVTDGVGTLASIPGTTLSGSQAGVLAYRTLSAGTSQLAWYDRSGKRFGVVGEPGPYRQAALSPDGKRAVFERLDPLTNTWDLWSLDMTTRIVSRLTFDPADDSDPVWSPDSRQIAFASSRKGHLDIYRKVIGASNDELVKADLDRKVPEWWLNDGTILYTTNTGKDYYQIATEGEQTPKRIFHADFSTDEPCVSPDGHWVAFNSLESGRYEVYIAAFPGFTDKQQVSNDGGGQARWRADGKELYYLSLDGKMMAVDVTIGSGLETSVPRRLFEVRPRAQPQPLFDLYGVTSNGKSFLVVDPEKDAPSHINVILDWLALLPPRR